MSDTRSDLTVIELIKATRGHAVGVGLVESVDHTLHLPTCPHVLDVTAQPRHIRLAAFDRLPLCFWCLRQVNSSVLGTVIGLTADIATLVESAKHPSAAWAVALDGLTHTHDTLPAGFHPAVEAFASNQHRHNQRTLRNLRTSLSPDAAAGQSLRRSAMRIALYEATAAAATGDGTAGTDLQALVEDIVTTAPVSRSQLVPVMLSLAEWEAVRTVARPRGRGEWQRVANPPAHHARRLLRHTHLSPNSLEAFTTELLIDEMLQHLAAIDISRLDPTPSVPVRIDDGPHLTPATRALIWRRGRIHWLRGLIDLDLLGTSEDEQLESRLVAVPPVVGAALRLPDRLAGVSPVRAAPHHVLTSPVTP